jgi:hypothetical protein
MKCTALPPSYSQCVQSKWQVDVLKGILQRHKMPEAKDLDIVNGICEILLRHEFKPHNSGMVRPSTGCSFSWECILKYKTVADFQLDWPYA